VSLLRRSHPSTADAEASAASTSKARPAGATRAGAGRAGADPRAAEPVRVAGGTVGKEAGKGRPTPKRREAEGRRRGPAPAPPRTQREASKLARANRPDREQRKQQRMRETERRRAGMARGDDRYLPVRDRGPVRAYVRDVVDSRPHLIGLFMPLALIVVASAFIPVPAVQQYMSLFSLVMLIVMIGEGIWLGRTVTAKARERFPNEDINAVGTGWYSFTRASQPRRLRMPKPRVERGDNP
jgi:Protein of unknown function (DUF3043)